MKPKKKTKPEKWEIEAVQGLRKRIFDLEQVLLRTEQEKQAAYADMESYRSRWDKAILEANTWRERYESNKTTYRRIWLRIGRMIGITDECDNA